eukprot:1879299-Lingulodinium_polyedra.AAC.1
MVPTRAAEGVSTTSPGGGRGHAFVVRQEDSPYGARLQLTGPPEMRARAGPSQAYQRAVANEAHTR